MKDNNKNDPLEAQKRLFGTIKNIGNKIQNRDHDDSSKKGEDPAYRYIKNSNANWKNELNDEEKEYLKNRPGSFFETQSLFQKRFLSYKKFIEKQKEQTKESRNIPVKSNLENKNAAINKEELPLKKIIKTPLITFTCPKCASPINQNDLFCGECGYKLEGLKLSKNIKEEKEETLIKIKKENIANNDLKESSKLIKEKKVKKQNTSNELNTKKQSYNDLPIETLEILKSFFDDQLINESEYNTLRKSALNISHKSDSNSSDIKEIIPSIKSISREKLSELKVLFDKELIDKEEYDLLRRNLLFIK